MHKIDEKEIEALRRVIKKSLYRYSSHEKTECDLFEESYSKKIGVKHSLLVNSGTNALVAALKALGVKTGDEVIVPTYTFVATVNAVLSVGALPVLVKINDQFGFDLHDLTNKISVKTKCILVVHMDGLSSNIKDVKKLSESLQIPIIEDAAQAMGGYNNNQALGSIGDIGCFSLNENKLLSCGEGGILVTSSSDLYLKAHALHDTPSQWSPSRKHIFEDRPVLLGDSMRVSEIQGALMNVQLSRYDEIIKNLKTVKSLFTQYFSQRMIFGDCVDGDSCSSIHFKFQSIEEVKKFISAQEKSSFIFKPILQRPAHHASQWFKLINLHVAKNIYSPIDFIEERQKLGLILKLDIQAYTDLKQYEELASDLRLFFRNLKPVEPSAEIPWL